MLYGNIDHIEDFGYLPKAVLDCFAYLKTHNLRILEPGRYEIDGDNLFVNLSEYTTTYSDRRFWEAHREYLDVHVVLAGVEQIELNFIANMQLKPYEAEKDFLPMDGDARGSVLLSDGDFLICYPNDAHKTALTPTSPGYVKKAIFKVKL